MAKLETIAITGASGFVGQHLMATLMKHSDCNLRVLVRGKQYPKAYLNDRVKVIIGDLTNRDHLFEFIKPGSIVVNLAYLSSNSLQENLKAARNLMSVCKKNNIKRLIHCSTAAVAGRAKETIVTEETECRPLNDYEATKLEIEKALMEDYGQQFELVIIRPTAIYGPGVQNLMKLAKELTDGNWFLCYLRSSLFNRRKMNLVSIENVTQAILHLSFIDKNIDGQVYIISDDDQARNNYHDVERLLRKHLAASGYFLPIIPLPQSLLSIALLLLGRSNINPSRVYNSEKLRGTGYSGKVMIEDGIALFADWYKKENLRRKPAGQ